MASQTIDPGIKILEQIAEETAKTSFFLEDEWNNHFSVNEKRASLIKGIGVALDNNIKETTAVETNTLALATAEKVAKSDQDQVKVKNKEDELKKITVFSSMRDELKSNFGDLKGSITEDFGVLSMGLQEIGNTPGLKSIIALLKFATLVLGKMLFGFLAQKFFPDLTKFQEDGVGVDFKATLDEMKSFFKDKFSGGQKDKDWKGTDKDAELEPGKPKAVGGFAGFEEVEESSSGIFAPMKNGFESMKKSTGEFFKPMVDGWNTLKADGETRMVVLSDMFKQFMSPLTEGWKDMKDKGIKKFDDMKTAVSEWTSGMMTNLKNGASTMGKNIKKSFMNSKAMESFRAASLAVATGFKLKAAALMGHVKRLVAPIAAFIVASLSFMASLMIAAAAMIAPALPWIAIGVIIALIVVGLIFLGKYLMDSWETVKEKFSIAMEGLGIWVDKAALWLGGMLSPMRDGVARFFGAIMDGIANMVNGAIEWINSKKPDWIPGGDLIDWRMDADNVAKAEEGIKARATERVQEGEDIKAREGALADRRAALAGDQAGAGDSNNALVNNTTNNNTNQTHVQRIEPNDRYAGMSAVAQ
jgi:hypothetical protein